MKQKETAQHIALFVDLENFVGFCLALGLPLDLEPEIERLTETGKITARRSFGDIYKMPIPGEQKQELRKMLQRNLVQHEDVPYHNAFKNSSDIRLVIEALTMAYGNSDVDTIAVVANDRDYLPLFAKLREIGKEVIGIGGNRDHTPELYVRSCDAFYYHENLTGRAPAYGEEEVLNQAMELAQPDAPTATAGLKGQPGAGREAVQLLLDALKAHEAGGVSTVTGAAVSQTMRRMQPDLDLASCGFPSFKSLCERAAQESLISIEHNGASFKLKLPDRSGQPAKTVEPPGAMSGQELLEWAEGKMRARFPAQGARFKVYEKLKLLEELPAEGIQLIKLSEQIAKELPRQEINQTSCFKLLYCLYRANSFTCSQGGSAFNPVVHGLGAQPLEAALLDQRFIQNMLQVFRREMKQPISTAAWSELMFGCCDKGQEIAEILAKL